MLSESVGVVIGTYGDRGGWVSYVQRAALSLQRQTHQPNQWVQVHGASLQQARNLGAEMVGDNDWLIFLDADDELDPLYIEAMLNGTGDIRRPATLGVYEDGSEDDHPVMIPRKDLNVANYIVIGAMCRSRYFFAVGGFDDWPILEDWDLWRRMVAMGATVGDVPEAIYRVHVRSGSRNQDAELHRSVYQQIRKRK